jgi:hypothetical protein
MDSEIQLITMIYSKFYYVNKIADSYREVKSLKPGVRTDDWI